MRMEQTWNEIGSDIDRSRAAGLSREQCFVIENVHAHVDRDTVRGSCSHLMFMRFLFECNDAVILINFKNPKLRGELSWIVDSCDCDICSACCMEAEKVSVIHFVYMIRRSHQSDGAAVFL